MFMEAPALPPMQTAEEFEREVAPKLAPPPKIRGGFISSFMGAPPQREWIVKGALTARTILLVYGEPGCGKSFLMLDLAANLTRAVVEKNHPCLWFGRKIKPCAVAYVAAEGEDDFIFRSYGVGLNDRDVPFYLIPTAIDMRTSGAPTDKLIDDLERAESAAISRFGVGFGLVVFDTLNKCLAGGDDSKPQDVGPLLINSNRVREKRKAAVCLLHHLPKGLTAGDPRGHSSLKGDIDFHWLVRGPQNGAPNSWKITRTKVGASGDRHEFRLRQMFLWKDADGEDETTCIVEPLAREASPEAAEMQDAVSTSRSGKPYMTADGRAILYDNRFLAMAALQDAIDKEASKPGIDQDLPPTTVAVPHGRVAVRLKNWGEELLSRVAWEDKASPKAKDRLRKAIEAAGGDLQKRNLIVVNDDWVWRTGRKVASIDKAERIEIPREAGATPNEAEAIPF